MEAAARFRCIGYVATTTPIYVKQKRRLRKAQTELAPQFNATWKITS
jgi:hypothetical protein